MSQRDPSTGLLCGAKTKTGGSCTQYARANGRCRLHGGLVPRGANSLSFRTGRYSKYVPKRLLKRYEEAEGDPELLALRAEISLMDARLGEMLETVDQGESTTIWRALLVDWKAFTEARDSGRVDRMQDALQKVDATMNRADKEVLHWREIDRLVETRRKLVESERKRLVEMHQMLTTEEALNLLYAVTGVIRTYVTDQATLLAITRDFSGLVANRASRAISAID